MKQVQELLVHASLQTIEDYLSVMVDHLEKAIDSLV